MGSTNVLGLVLAKHQVESGAISYQLNGVLKQSILDEKDILFRKQYHMFVPYFAIWPGQFSALSLVKGKCSPELSYKG